MSSSPNNSLPSDPNSPATARPSTPPAQTSISLDERPLSEENDNMASPSLPVDSQRPFFSPSDCCTLQKILHDVRSPSPFSTTPYFNDTPASRLNLTATPNSGVKEDEANLEDDGLDHGNERQDGYEDEDDSMELSDGEDAFRVDEEKDGDTIEDVMNLPGKTAPPVPVRDYSSFYAHDKPPSDGARELELRRASIERDLAEQCRQQERAQSVATADGVYDADVPIDGIPDGTPAIEDSHDLKALQEDIGIYLVEEKRIAIVAPGSSEAYRDLPQAPTTSSNVRRASEGTPPASTSFITFPSPACAVVQTPNRKHIDFAISVPIPDAPLNNTSNYFESQEDEEGSPSQRRRNASLPEEIAELAREARVEEEEAAEQKELAELDQFRDMDLAPIETVMEGGPAGDLIICGTPVKAKDEELFLRRASDTSDFENEDWNDTQRSQSAIPSPRRNTLLVEQDEENDADVEESDTASSSEQQQLTVFPRPPTFVTVIGMLPAAMFWATAAPVVEGSSKAFDMLIEKLTGLKV